jgi:hypothetical protein
MYVVILLNLDFDFWYLFENKTEKDLIRWIVYYF